MPWYEQLQRIPAGTRLYEVFGITNPPEIAEEFPNLGLTSDRMKIGDIILETELMTSNFGDTRLFFQHDRVGKDLRLNREKRWGAFQERINRKDPENTWLPNNETIPLPEDVDAAQEIILHGLWDTGCPFAWLLGLVDMDGNHDDGEEEEGEEEFDPEEKDEGGLL